MNSVPMRSIFAGLAMLALTGTGGLADDNDGWWPRWGMMGGGMMHGWGGPMMGYGPDVMLDRIDGRLAFLKTELKITDAQATAWDSFAQAVRSTAEAHNTLMRGMMDEMHDGKFFKKPLPERLTYQQSMMETHLEQIRTVRSAVDALYAVLDDTQKKAADDIVLPMMGMGMGRGMGPGMMFRN
jgi:hypothetical protein